MTNSGDPELDYVLLENFSRKSKYWCHLRYAVTAVIYGMISAVEIPSKVVRIRKNSCTKFVNKLENFSRQNIYFKKFLEKNIFEKWTQSTWSHWRSESSRSNCCDRRFKFWCPPTPTTPPQLFTPGPPSLGARPKTVRSTISPPPAPP
jgi:hypothetical protein